MAKQKKDAKEQSFEFFGTRKEWVVGKNPIPQLGSEFQGAHDIIAKDDKGYYFTCSTYVGAGLLDPNRMYKRMVPTDETIAELNKSLEDVKEASQ